MQRPRRVVLAVAALLVGASGIAFLTPILCTPDRQAQATRDLLEAARNGYPKRKPNSRPSSSCAALIADALRRGADPDARYGSTPSPTVAAFQRLTRIPIKMNDSSPEAIHHWPVLVMTAYQGDPEAMKALLQAGANPRATGDYYENVIAGGIAADSLEEIEIALRAGENPSLNDDHHWPALMQTQFSPSMTRLLLDHGADPLGKVWVYPAPLVDILKHDYTSRHQKHTMTQNQDQDFAQSLAMVESAAARKKGLATHTP